MNAFHEFEEKLPEIQGLLDEADAILVGVGSGMSSAAGYNHYHYNEVFREYFSDFEEAYGIRNMFRGFYYVYSNPGQQWGFYSRYIRFMEEAPIGKPYLDLREILKDKEYFLLTTNCDMQLPRSFPEERTCQFQGDFRYLQCCQPCHDRRYESHGFVEELLKTARGVEVDEARIPRCPECGRIMVPWVQDDTFLRGEDWKREYGKYEAFLKKWSGKKLLLLELGVGDMTPSVIKYPFWDMLERFPDTRLVSVNLEKSDVPEYLKASNVHVTAELGAFLGQLRENVELADPQLRTDYLHWSSFMQKEVDFWLKDSEKHTKEHCSRVLFFSLLLAKRLGLGEQGKEALALASCFHDSRRQDDWLDVGHGQRAAAYYREYVTERGAEPDERVAYVMAYHDRDDELGLEAIRRDFPEDPEAALLYQAFKDADALDRFRLAPDALDVRFLRTEPAKQMVELAKKTLRHGPENLLGK